MTPFPSLSLSLSRDGSSLPFIALLPPPSSHLPPRSGLKASPPASGDGDRREQKLREFQGDKSHCEPFSSALLIHRTLQRQSNGSGLL
ncbi:hypothetical protein OPV22_011223 [Ensete ventricosum]|uniref:Uncharacterized protein n=1 Tax=Ensete ventricosum TaxID=4639 RepID=A0AAV8RCZ8_ENSVE|nr:hypothetical protein OPV22_011223 [Ensete ventricosum]